MYRKTEDRKLYLAEVLCSKMSRPALGPTQLPVHWVLWVLPPMVKWPGCEGECLLLPSAKVESVSILLFHPLYLHGMDRDNCTFTFTLPLPLPIPFAFTMS